MAEIPQHRLGDVERKVLTLHTLQRLGSCGNLRLIGFMVENDIMNYFDLQTALFDLRDIGQVARQPQAADDLYEITPAGEEALGLFMSRVPQSLLDRVSLAAPAYREQLRREREKRAFISHEGQNEYHVTMEILEQQMPLLRLDLSLPTAELAARMRDNWGEQAQGVYEFIINQLSGRGKA